MQFDEKNQFNGNSKEKMEGAEIWEKEENQLKFGIVFACLWVSNNHYIGSGHPTNTRSGTVEKLMYIYRYFYNRI